MSNMEDVEELLHQMLNPPREQYWNEFFLSDNGFKTLDDLNPEQEMCYQASKHFYFIYKHQMWGAYERFACETEIPDDDDSITAEQAKAVWESQVMAPIEQAWKSFKKTINNMLELPDGMQLAFFPGEDDSHPRGHPKEASDAVHDSMKATLHFISKDIYRNTFLGMIAKRRKFIDEMAESDENGHISLEHLMETIQDEDLRSCPDFLQEYKADAAALEAYNRDYTWAPLTH